MRRFAADFHAGMQAAFLVARGRDDAVGRIDGPAGIDARAVAHSFWAMLLCLPPYLALHAIDWRDAGIPAHPAWQMALELAAYVVDWLGFAVVSHQIALKIDRLSSWPRFIALWNWCNVIQYMLFIAAAIPGLVHAPDWVGETVTLVAMGWALWLEWFAARTALRVSTGVAVAVTAMDAALGAFVYALVGLVAL